MRISIPSHLTNANLLDAVKRMAGGEREATAQLVAHMAELDARRLYEPAAYSSMFTFCCQVLHMSEDAAYNRIEAARAVRKYPSILNALTEGGLTVTTVRLLARRLTADNHGALLGEAKGKSKREVEEIVARHYPQPDVPSSVRKLSAPASEAPTLMLEPPSLASTPSVATPPPSPSPVRRPTVAPLSEDRYLVKFTVSAATRRKLELAQDLLRHANPSGDPAEIFDRALTLLVAELEREKFAATKKPRASRGVKPGSRHIPAGVRRQAAEQDGRSCGFVGTDGRRCSETALLEYDHSVPVAAGGLAKDGIRLRCRAHNGHEAELFFGDWFKRPGVQHGPGRVSRENRRIGGGGDPRPPSANSFTSAQKDHERPPVI